MDDMNRRAEFGGELNSAATRNCQFSFAVDLKPPSVW
jgi:hypothetical protein